MHNSDVWEDLDGKKLSGLVGLANITIQLSLCHDS